MNNLKRVIAVLIIAFIPFAMTCAQVVVPSSDLTDSATQRVAPGSIDINRTEMESGRAPFGSNLFKGASFSAERADGLNPDYIIQPGDRIALRIWGATTIEDLAVVDAQGNIFIPEVGPIQIAGTRNGDLNGRIRTALGRVFTQNINVYTNLQGTTPVLVFVTGFVNRPGSYAGVASDSLLYFLERAGGIDLTRGSYRNIRVLRDGLVIAETDLYEFLLNGLLPRPQFTDGDTIVVEKRGDSITAEGAVRNSYSFEIPAAGVTGQELINYARPWSNATYATVLGTRSNAPFSIYIPLNELEGMTLYDGDQVLFEIDQTHDNILIRVEGSHLGQSRFSVPRNTHLLDILDFIKVDPALADITSISIRRESLKVRQKQAILDSLTRLETAVLSRTAVTSEGAEIQLAEAQLITDFVKRARQVEPEGILVVSKDANISNILLQPEDVITIPEKTNVIQVSGEVMVPQALVYEPDNTVKDYIDRVGGYSEHADKRKHMILRRNGEVIPVFGSVSKVAVLPGDEIISLPEIPSKSIDVIRMVTDTMFKIASSAAIFLRF
jgi:protein involved in polysaccharide export with SLBB domain